MDWELISTFVEVIDSGNLSEAARRRGVTRSSISQRLKTLERQANAQLLRRTTRRLEPTQAGQALYEHGVRMAQEADAARNAIEGLAQTLRGHVRLSMPPGLGDRHVRGMLLEFCVLFPGIGVTAVFSNKITDLIRSEIDVALRIDMAPPPDSVARGISNIDWALYASPRYVEEHPKLSSPSDLANCDVISPLPGRTPDVLMLTDGRSVSVKVTPRVVSEGLSFLVDCVRADLGVALLPTYMVNDLVANGGLLRVLPEWHNNQIGDKLFILTTPNRFPTPAASALIDFLKERLNFLATGQ